MGTLIVGSLPSARGEGHGVWLRIAGRDIRLATSSSEEDASLLGDLVAHLAAETPPLAVQVEQARGGEAT
jgi:hypothetical protein